MQTRIHSWLGREFIELSGEAQAAASVEQETNNLFQRFEQELKGHGLSLQNTVRTRAWGKDREARTLATAARSKILTGDAKSGKLELRFAVSIRLSLAGRARLRISQTSRIKCRGFLKPWPAD